MDNVTKAEVFRCWTASFARQILVLVPVAEKKISMFFLPFFNFFLNISFYLRIFYLFFVRFPLQNANGEEMSEVLFRFILLYYFA